MEMERKIRWNAGYWIAALLLLLAFQAWLGTTAQVEQVPYSQVESYLAEGRGDEVVN